MGRRSIRTGAFMLATALGLPAVATAQPLLLAQAYPSQQAADAVLRVGQLEEEVRQLRGRIEELQYQNQQLQQRLDAATANGADAGGSGAPAPAASAAAPPAEDAQSAQAPAAGGTPPAPQAGSQSLGKLPQGAVTDRTPQEQQKIALKAAALNPTAPAKDQYDAGLKLMQQGDWTTARSAFENLITKYPKDQLAPNAAYWLGETYYVTQQYDQAAATFARNFQTYGSDAQKAPDTLLKLGMSLAANGDKAKACAVYSQLDKRYPSAAAPIRQTLVRERASAGCG